MGESVFNLEEREIIVAKERNKESCFFSETAREYFKIYVEAKKIKFKERYNPDILFVNSSANQIK